MFSSSLPQTCIHIPSAENKLFSALKQGLELSDVLCLSVLTTNNITVAVELDEYVLTRIISVKLSPFGVALAQDYKSF